MHFRFASVVIGFALLLLTSPNAAATADRAVVENFLAAGRVRPEPAQLLRTFEEAYLAYFARAKGSASDADLEVIARARASLDPLALYTTLVDLYVEELSEDEAALALAYYRIQPPDDIRQDKEAVGRWVESLPARDKETIERFRSSETGRSVQAKVLKVTLLVTVQTASLLVGALDIQNKESSLRALSNECEEIYEEGDAFKILMVCSLAASVPCAPCELNIGMVYLSGALFPRDARRGLTHIRSAALLNHATAQGYYGRMLVRQDYPPAGSVTEGIQWLMRSAENGLQAAEHELATEREEHPNEVRVAKAGYEAFLKANEFKKP